MKQKLLIIEDDDAIFTLLKNIFIKKYSIYKASDGVEALLYLSNRLIPDLIIINLKINNVSGPELVKHLSTSKVLSKIPVIAVSNFGRAEQQKIRTFANVAGVFSKPFDPLQLSHAVDATIGKPAQVFNSFRLSPTNILNPLN